jgi:hypothetical protein
MKNSFVNFKLFKLPKEKNLFLFASQKEIQYFIQCPSLTITGTLIP